MRTCTWSAEAACARGWLGGNLTSLAANPPGQVLHPDFVPAMARDASGNPRIYERFMQEMVANQLTGEHPPPSTHATPTRLTHPTPSVHTYDHPCRPPPTHPLPERAPWVARIAACPARQSPRGQQRPPAATAVEGWEMLHALDCRFVAAKAGLGGVLMLRACCRLPHSRPPTAPLACRHRGPAAAAQHDRCTPAQHAAVDGGCALSGWVDVAAAAAAAAAAVADPDAVVAAVAAAVPPPACRSQNAGDRHAPCRKCWPPRRSRQLLPPNAFVQIRLTSLGKRFWS